MNYTGTPTNSMITKRITDSRRRRRILYIVLFCFLSWAAFTFAGQIQKLQEQRDELAKTQAELVLLQQQHTEYKTEIERLNDIEYIEQLARKEYFLSKPGDILFITPNSDKE
jgi:cell division protein DivIC